MVEQIYPPPHVIVQKWLYDHYPDDGSIDPRRSDIRWGEAFSGQADITLIVEGGIPNSKFINNGDTLKDNRQLVTLTASVRDMTGGYPVQIHNLRNFIKRFIRLNHSSDELIHTYNVDGVFVRKMNTQKTGRTKNPELQNVYRLTMTIDVLYMTQIIV